MALCIDSPLISYYWIYYKFCPFYYWSYSDSPLYNWSYCKFRPLHNIIGATTSFTPYIILLELLFDSPLKLLKLLQILPLLLLELVQISTLISYYWSYCKFCPLHHIIGATTSCTPYIIGATFWFIIGATLIHTLYYWKYSLIHSLYYWSYCKFCPLYNIIGATRSFTPYILELLYLLLELL